MGNDRIFIHFPVDRVDPHVGEPRQASDPLGFLTELHHAKPQAFPLWQRDRLVPAELMPNWLRPAPAF